MPVPTMAPQDGPPPRLAARQLWERDMPLEALSAKTPASLDELTNRVFYALQRHPLCRQVEFDIRQHPAAPAATNWTVSDAFGPARRACGPRHEIVADIQEAYELDRLRPDFRAVSVRISACWRGSGTLTPHLARQPAATPARNGVRF